MQNVLITGAAGNVGSATLRNLASSGASVRALIHSGSTAEQLKHMEVELVYADLGEPHTLGAAFDGVDRILLITPLSLDAVALAHNAISAARQSGNPHVVYLSANVPEPVNETEVGRQRTAIEAELTNSGLPYTILRPTFFMQNTLMAAQTVATDGTMYLPFGEGRLAMLDIRDVGAATASVLTSDGHEGNTYTLTGPASISFNEVASTLSSILGKVVVYAHVPLAAAKEAMIGMGMPGWMADMYNEMFKNFSQNGAAFATDDVERITGVPATPYRQFAQDFAAAFGA